MSQEHQVMRFGQAQIYGDAPGFSINEADDLSITTKLRKLSKTALLPHHQQLALPLRLCAFVLANAQGPTIGLH